jgi:hypothetical protein
MRSLTLVKVPRRMTWRVMIEKKISTMFSHEPEVGVKCRVTRLFPGQPPIDLRVLVSGVVVTHDVQLLARVGLRDLAEELRNSSC